MQQRNGHAHPSPTDQPPEVVQVAFTPQTANAVVQISTMILGEVTAAFVKAVADRAGRGELLKLDDNPLVADTIPVLAANCAINAAKQLVALHGSFVGAVQAALQKASATDEAVREALRRKSQGFDDSRNTDANDARPAGASEPAMPGQGSVGLNESSAGSGAEDAVATPGRIVTP